MRAHTIALGILLTVSAAQTPAQAPPPATAPRPGTSQPAATPSAAPTGLVVGSGNFFSPIVQDLDKAVAFYRDGLGLDVQGEQGDAASNLALRSMFGLPDAVLRWQIARPPVVRGGVEIVEVSKAGGKPLERRYQDPGAFTLIVFVRDIDATLARLEKLGAAVTTVGGAPVSVPFGEQRARLVMVKDPAGHFVELVQPDQPPATTAPATANVVGVRVRLTVDDVERSMRLYRDALGMKALNTPAFRDDPVVARALGVEGAQYRFGTLEVPTTGLVFEVMDFKGIDRRKVEGRIQDPGSTRFQLLVRDIDAAIAELKKVGGEVVSTGGVPLELPAGNTKIKVAIAREPDNLFIVLIQTPPATR
jgi:catechol 2,3-dioxygenase-like lactoylglutathione lyase family enzyme